MKVLGVSTSDLWGGGVFHRLQTCVGVFGVTTSDLCGGVPPTSDLCGGLPPTSDLCGGVWSNDFRLVWVCLE